MPANGRGHRWLNVKQAYWGFGVGLVPVIVGGFAVLAGGFAAVFAAVLPVTFAGFGGNGVGRCCTGAVVAGAATLAFASVVAGGTSVEIVPLDQI